ncbi:MAG: beta-galactosidase trimerization domain-containing protein, partial [Planctomycetota bacterium]|nr:beta-galactosidase trimerization domain-containing protein [Planctomycetota bacterium]
ADAGANFSPHAGAPYVGDANKYITVFRQEGMTMPWGEDYIWQIPVGSQQMNFLQTDMFRAGLRYGPPTRAIQMYVMPHWPGNTLAGWRRQFYGVLGSGARIINLFEFRPVQAAYTENHVSLPEMFLEVRKGLFELGGFEDIVQDGHVRWGDVALWYSQTGDIWGNPHPRGAAKRSLYVAIRHQQVPLDIVDEEDALKGTLKTYHALYLTDSNVSTAASKAIAAWVADGGRLFATAGAGMFDEYNAPNTVMRELLGVDQQSLEDSGLVIQFEKQDLPFAKPVAQVTWNGGAGERKLDVYGTISKVKLFQPEGDKMKTTTQIQGKFADGSPAVTVRRYGKGLTTYCAFLPSLTYFKPAIPLRPVDRGSTDDAMAHLIPTAFDAGADELIGSVVADLPRAVVCSEKLVQASILDGPKGVLIPLVNWSAGPVKGLKVTLTGKFPGKATLAGGGKVAVAADNDKTVLTLDLDVADAIVLR